VDGVGDPVFESLPGGSLGIPEPTTAGFRVFAPWAEEGPIDIRNTCDGDNASPAISWSDVPDQAVELAVSYVDESALSNGRPFVHWVIAGLDPASGRLDEATVPAGALQALNFFGDVGYGGPCPPIGETHTYRLTLYALDQQVEVADGTPAAEFLDTLDALAIGSTSTLSTATR
jgi:Raf kinase inhibitor-like YbhB/YbcL family protein